MSDDRPDRPQEPRGVMFSSRRNRRRSAYPPMAAWAILLVIVLAAVGGWYWFRSRAGAPTPAPTTAAADATAPAPEEPFVLPSLDTSDRVVRELAERLSAHPQLASWLVTDDLIQRFVVAVVDLSRGSSPAPVMESLVPEQPFSVRQSGDRLMVDPRSYRRYDLLADVFTSVDAQGAAATYQKLLPLFEEAYRQLGIPGSESFQGVFARAMDNLLTVEVPSGPVEVQEAVGRYVYSDRSIESLTPAAKHLYRMGPENAQRVQAKIREITGLLDLPPVPGR